jgi:hypothetical protein
MVNPKDLESVRAYLQANKETIIQNYKASGAGVGKQNLIDDSYVIVVYLQDNKNLPQEQVIVDGIPLKFVVTGLFSLHRT